MRGKYLVLKENPEDPDQPIVMCVARYPGEAQHEATQLATDNPLRTFFVAEVISRHDTESPVPRFTDLRLVQ